MVLYQNHESSIEASVRVGDVECTYSIHGVVGQAADVWIMVTPEASELLIQMWYSRCTLPEEKAKWAARLLQTFLETIPAVPEQPIHRIAHDKKEVLASAAAAISDQPSRQGAGVQSVGELCSPRVHTRTIVSQAWDEVGLAVPSDDGQTKEDCSMFSGGADLVTTMLLARSYQRRGYGLSMQDVVDYPTQEGQSRLLESKKELDGMKDR